MFDKILIANRGEIACRIARSARRLGIATVAVYSEVDGQALHVRSCDEAHLIGSAAARDSYLCGERIVEVARRSGAQAVHPGYGFLSENVDFAEACDAAGLVFIGPPSPAIAAMGSKRQAKNLMQAAGVPLLPGYHGDDQGDGTLRREAAAIGFPLLIKASAGGGGKGMRVVEHADAFADALISARREAQSAFASQTVILERYLAAPRHVEVQVFADHQGNIVHLFERDCSLQRRYQKVIEEAPAPGLSADLRARMGQAAITAARAIDYVGAGTVEFLLDPRGEFYFMEMNTRLQVEHPVTEMITGQDLVEWQLRVAAREALPMSQQQLNCNGHAFEARIYAETPARDFLPATGAVEYLRQPEEGAHVRIDTGIVQGDDVGMHYDPLLAKLIVWGEDRVTALRRLRAALADYAVLGVNTNLGFLARVCAQPEFAAAQLNTGFIDHHAEALFPGAERMPDDVLALACLHELLRRQQRAQQRQRQSGDPYSPWGDVSGWRLNQDALQGLFFVVAGDEVEVMVHGRPAAFELELPGGKCRVAGELSASGDLLAAIDGRRCKAVVVCQGETVNIFYQGRTWQMLRHDPRWHVTATTGGCGGLAAPLPGVVIEVRVAPGDQVRQGDALIVVEAMKMEHTVSAPKDGAIKTVCFAVGDLVDEGAELLRLE